MEQRDYLLREIAKIGDMLRYFVKRLTEQKDKKEEEEFTEQIDTELFNDLGVEMNEFLKLTDQKVYELIEKNAGLNSENMEILGDLLNGLAMVDEENQNRYYQKALLIYQYINRNSDTYNMSISEKISQLEKRIGNR